MKGSVTSGIVGINEIAMIGMLIVIVIVTRRGDEK